MRKPLLFLAIGAVLAVSASSQQPASGEPDAYRNSGAQWWEHVRYLASDEMEGRETGSPALRRAEDYLVEQLKLAGAEPAGAIGFFQNVRFESRQISEKDSSLFLIHENDKPADTLVLGEDAIFNTRVDLARSVDAPLVFVGYGLTIPEKNYDDLAGLDLKGKVAVLLAGSPSEIPGALASHYQSAGERWKALKKAGAVGTITILNPGSMDIPWSRISANRTHASMALAGHEFDETAGQKLALTFNPARAERLFADAPINFEQVLALAHDRRPLPRFALAVTIRAKAAVNKKNLESANVVAKFPGSDPSLKNEYVVLSAHVDHIGIGEPINGDRIYNGAMDNASGCAVLLDLAASLRKSPEKLKRSILLVFVTGEEKGLLGSRYFTAHPTVTPGSMVADINIDMFLPIVPLKVLTVYGLSESDVGDRVREAASTLGVAVQSDPEPLRNAFIRSDQYNFIRHGIPAVAMGVGFESGSAEQQLFKDWRTQRYHAPSDDLNQPVDLATAGKYQEVVRTLMVLLANREQRPQWKTDSFFRRYAQMGAGSF
jgi:peptidase M28-like protein